MPEGSRRDFLMLVAGATAAIAAGPVGQAGAQEIMQLPPPRMKGGMPLMEALALRRSIRTFADKPIAPETLSSLLWAGFGINRKEGSERTAPSWRGAKENDIYVANAQGVWLFDPETPALRRITNTDVRKGASGQPFVATAPLVLIYVADMDRMSKAPEEEQRLYGQVDTAFIAQNVYLFCASEGLATVIMAGHNRAFLSKALALRERQLLTLIQPAGYPG